MKKIINVITCLLLIFPIAACWNKSQKDEKNNAQTEVLGRTTLPTREEWAYAGLTEPIELPDLKVINIEANATTKEEEDVQQGISITWSGATFDLFSNFYENTRITLQANYIRNDDDGFSAVNVSKLIGESSKNVHYFNAFYEVDNKWYECYISYVNHDVKELGQTIKKGTMYLSLTSYGQTSASSTTTKIEAVVGGSIEVLSNGSTWGENVDLSLEGMNTSNADISGDGSMFYTQSGRESTDYVEFALQFRASSFYGIYLNSLSAVTPVASTLQGAGSDNKSNYGNFSKDLIAASVRVAFIYEDEVQLVWAPNSNYTLSGTTGSYSVNLADTAAKTYQYASAPGELGTFSVTNSNFLATSSADVTPAGVTPTLYDNKNLIAAIAPDVDGESKTVSVTVRMWIDGNDPECSVALLGGEFKTTLGFSAVELVQESRPTVSTVAVKNTISNLITGYTLAVTGNASDFEVSTDRGVSYSNYDAATTYVNQAVLVRKKASATANKIPSLTTNVYVGRLTQPSPTASVFTADHSTRTLSASSYEPSSTSGGVLQYSINGGTSYLDLTAPVQVSSTRTEFLIRYAENGNYSASEPITIVMEAAE